MPGTVNRGSSLLAGFRARRHRAAVLALLGGLLLAQSLLFAHRIDHDNGGHTVVCLLCLVADHPAVASAYALPVFAAPKPVPVAASVPVSAALVVVLAYRSRAPPEHVAT